MELFLIVEEEEEEEVGSMGSMLAEDYWFAVGKIRKNTIVQLAIN